MSNSMASKIIIQILLLNLLALYVFAAIHSSAPSNGQENVIDLYPRQIRSPFDMMMLTEKREMPLTGYGWDQCEFSPMSCLLRKRRSVR